MILKYFLPFIFVIKGLMAATSFPASIPPHIGICYENATLTNRINRFPLSMDNLIALVRKIENHPSASLWTIQRLAGSLLKRFRFDGIVDSSNVGAGFLPVERESVETDKHRLIWALTPGYDTDFPNDILTLEEQCSLHWMLSYTVNHTRRIEEYQMRQAPTARSIRNDPNIDTADPQPVDDNHQEQFISIHSETVEKHEYDLPKSDHTEEGVEDKSEENRREPVPDSPASKENEDDEEPSAGDYDDHSDHEERRKRETQKELSFRPLEVGVVYSKGGTVAPGIVLSGIVAGLEPQSVKVKDIVKDPALDISNDSMERVIESQWVVTLAGDMAQTAVLRASKNKKSVGPGGLWNDTYCPRERALEWDDHSLLTIAEIFGGMDGLLMAREIVNWNKDYMKLSTILEMYYSNDGIYGYPQYRACNRINLFREKIDQAMLRDQSLNAALVYYSKGMNGIPPIGTQQKPIDVLRRYIEITYDEFNGYIGSDSTISLEYAQCQGAPSITNIETPATYTDVTFVIDQSTDSNEIRKQKQMISALANYLDIQAGGSRLEVVSSYDGNPFITMDSTVNKAQLACMIDKAPIGYNQRRISSVLSRMRSRIAQERTNERRDKVSGANTRTILFFIGSNSGISADKTNIQNELQKMVKEMLDVHLMFATLGSSEELRPFVADFDRDILRMISYSSYTLAAGDIAKRIAKVGARLFYPACSQVTGVTETDFIYSIYLNPRTVQYFRVGAEHFHSSSSVTFRFKSQFGTAKVCHSRDKPNPTTTDSCKTPLKSEETMEMRFNSPCGRDLPQNCKPIYFAVFPMNLDDGVPCSDKECHTPDQVKVVFSHEGMRCTGSAVHLIISNITLIICLISIWLFK